MCIFLCKNAQIYWAPFKKKIIDFLFAQNSLYSLNLDILSDIGENYKFSLMYR